MQLNLSKANWMLPVAMVGSIILWVVSRYEIFILNLECWLQTCFKCISVMDGKQLSKTNVRPIGLCFYFLIFFSFFLVCFFFFWFGAALG